MVKDQQTEDGIDQEDGLSPAVGRDLLSVHFDPDSLTL